MKTVRKKFEAKRQDPMAEWVDRSDFEKMDKRQHAEHYIELNGVSRKKVSATERQKIQRLLEETFGVKKSKEYLAQLEEKRLLDNLAFVHFMIDYGAKSKTFTPWVLKVPDACNLRAAFGQDVDGKKISESDPFWWWVVRDPMFVSARWRTGFVMEYLSGKKSVTILGAGYLPELQTMKKTPETLPKKVIACDMNDAAAKWGKKFAETVAMRGRLDYRHEDLLTTLMSLPDRSQDVIVSTGVASYCVEKLPGLIPLFFSKLKPGGKIVLDLQIKHWALTRNAEVFGWKTETFAPSNDVEDAIKTIEKACEKLAVESIDVCVDDREADPIGAMFVIVAPEAEEEL